jgi:DMSO reductase family type II enzyme heme b subunit
MKKLILLTILAFLVAACGEDGTTVSNDAVSGDASKGKAAYDKRCSQCHGDEGGALGPGAAFMLPRPRIFKEQNSYKIRVTASGALPTDRDLFNIISRGLPGTAMPGFDNLSEQERWDMVAYLKTFNTNPDEEEGWGDAELVADSAPVDALMGQIQVPEFTEDMVIAGKAIYESNKCWQCHGHEGRGNGPSWPDLKDDFPYYDADGKEIAVKTPILPTNLTIPDRYRGGAEPYDVFRTVTTGLNGTPMPAYADSITVEDRWKLVAFVATFHPPKQETRDEVVRAKRVDALPEADTEEAWAATGAAAARFPLLANVVEPPRNFWTSVEYVSAQAVYTETHIALRVQWDDRSESKGANIDHEYADRDINIYNTTDHPDQLAVQFAARNEDPMVRPYFLLGDSKRATNNWWWTAHDNKTTERNGKGWPNIKEQPQSSQGTTGRVTYSDGRYTAVFTRTLLTDNPKNDAQFKPGAFLPIAFNIWDGSRGEVGNRRNLSTWYWLQLEPPIPPNQKYVAPTSFGISLFFMIGLVLWVQRRRRQ